GNSGRPQFTFTPSSHSSSFSSSSAVTNQSGENASRCHHCNEPGHFRNHCRIRNFCTYCKKSGHIILDCKARNRRSGGVGSSDTSAGSRVAAFAIQPSSSESSISEDDRINQMVQAALQQVLPQALQAAFSTLGVTGSENQDHDRERT
ncbi:hypothetical protein LINGRAHAP2_LOCUS19660, partial [Linum grandiflorum]